MKLQGRIPVEPLDEERLTNIERRLVVGVSELRPAGEHVRRGHGLGFAAAALAAACAAVIGWKLHAPATPDARDDAAPQELAIVGEQGHQAIELGDATIASAAGTRAHVSRTATRTVIALAHGTLDLAVVHDPARTLVIRAGETEIEDVGTKFSVNFDGTSAVDVRVTEGEVAVTRNHKRDRVVAGREWHDGELIALVEPPAAQVAQDAPAQPPGANGSATTATATATVAVTEPPPILRDHHAAVPVAAPVARHEPAAQPVLGEHVPPRGHTAIAQAAIANDPYVDLQVAIRRQPLAFDPHIDGKADATTEIARLKLVAYSPTTLGADASAAMYRMAVLLDRPLGQDAEALRTVDLYLRRFSAGKERDAALWLRVRIVCAHSIDETCRQAAYSYQHAVNTGDASDVAVRITNAQ